MRAALVALVLLGPGCKERQKEAPPPSPEAPAPEAPAPGGRPAAPRRVGVKVPMPPGWSAQVEQDGSFHFGPPGRPVLRVDLRPGQGAALPSPEELTESLGKSFEGFERSLDQEEGGEDFTLVRVTLAPRWGDGGVGAEYPALFGARRVGKDLFLCATSPGITPEEVRQAAEACRGIEFQQPR